MKGVKLEHGWLISLWNDSNIFELRMSFIKFAASSNSEELKTFTSIDEVEVCNVLTAGSIFSMLCIEFPGEKGSSNKN